MNLLSGRKILITGMLSKHSIAYGIAQACADEGAILGFTYEQPRFYDRVAELVSEFEGAWLLPCDVRSEDQINVLFSEVSDRWGTFDGFVHSMAFADRTLISGEYLSDISKDMFQDMMDVSVYSLSALSKAAKPYLSQEASIVTLSYLGAERAVPHYNMMGVAKSALESSVRYLARDLGTQGVRVNTVSAGPIKTFSSSAIQGFSNMLNHVAHHAPLKRSVTSLEVGKATAFLLSNMASGITAQTIYVDAGYAQVAPIE